MILAIDFPELRNNRDLRNFEHDDLFLWLSINGFLLASQVARGTDEGAF